MKLIPNLFTLLNLFTGVIAIIFALQTEAIYITQDDQMVSSFNIPERLALAGICIFIAAVFDFFDGFISRLLKASSELGKQLDSLSDVVSFGVAPAVIIYQLLRMSYAKEPHGLDVSLVYLWPAIVIACAAAYRLGKFNLAEDQKTSFKGVPTPAAALLVASLPLIIHFGDYPVFSSFITNKWILYLCIVILSYLMVSEHRMMALKFTNFKIKEKLDLVILLVIAVISAILFKWLAVPIVFLFYVIISLVLNKKYHKNVHS